MVTADDSLLSRMQRILADPLMRNSAILIFANKQDLVRLLVYFVGGCLVCTLSCSVLHSLQFMTLGFADCSLVHTQQLR